MKIKKRLLKILSFGILLLGITQPILVPASPVYADHCASDEIAISVPVEQGGSHCIKKEGTGKDNPIFIYMRNIIKFIGAGVGMVLVLLVIVGGIRFTTAQGNPQAVQSAVKMIVSAVIGLIMFVLLFAIINYLLPGGVIT